MEFKDKTKLSSYQTVKSGVPDVCSLESYVDDSKLYLSFPVAEASNMIQQINKDLEKNRKLVLLQQPSHKPRENQAAGVGHTSDASEAAR